MVRIAIEATGCDKGFTEILEGAKRAKRKSRSLELVLVAGEDRLPESFELGDVELERTKYTYDFNKKEKNRESSIYRTIELHKNERVDCAIAPGDTVGAILYSIRLLRKLLNVSRPAIATHWPFNNVLIDSGANVDCSPEDLLQFAVMGKVYSENYLGVRNPLIGIMSNGEEDYKGTNLTKQSKNLISKLGGNGYNVSEKYFEGDVVGNLNGGWVCVTDGLTGNVALKVAEISLRKAYEIIKENMMNQNSILKAFAYIGTYKALSSIRKKIDYKNYAVAPLLGVNGNVMICHGRSDAETIANAILITEKYLKCRINEKLEEEIAKCGMISKERLAD